MDLARGGEDVGGDDEVHLADAGQVEAVRAEKKTKLTRATEFLHAEYEPAFNWWELIEVFKDGYLLVEQKFEEIRERAKC